MPRASLRVFLDTNVILECFRVGLWPLMAGHYQLETVEMCVREALTGDNAGLDRIAVDPGALRQGLHVEHRVDQKTRNRVLAECQFLVAMDDGERDLFVYLHANRLPRADVCVMSTADRGAILRSQDMRWLDCLVDLESLARMAGASQGQLARLANHFSREWLDVRRVEARFGIL